MFWTIWKTRFQNSSPPFSIRHQIEKFDYNSLATMKREYVLLNHFLFLKNDLHYWKGQFCKSEGFNVALSRQELYILFSSIEVACLIQCLRRVGWWTLFFQIYKMYHVVGRNHDGNWLIWQMEEAMNSLVAEIERPKRQSVNLFFYAFLCIGNNFLSLFS